MRRSRAARRGRSARTFAGGRAFPPSSAARHAARHLQDDQRQQVHAVPQNDPAGTSRRPGARDQPGKCPGWRDLRQRSGLHARAAIRLRRVGRAPARQQCRRAMGLAPCAAALPQYGREQPALRRAAQQRWPAACLRSRPHRRRLALVRPDDAGAGRSLHARLQWRESTRRWLLPVHEPARQTQQRRLCLHRAVARQSAAHRQAECPRPSDPVREQARRGRDLWRGEGREYS
jgi:hypothetical protein